MSLQHQNNKSLPKHLQHARIQKEEEEEQWISGEELCTEGEGSSDEDTNTKFGDFKKKLLKSGQSSASSLKSRNCSSANGSIKEKSDNNSDPKSLKPSVVEWRPKKDENSLYDIKAEKLDTEMKWKTTLEELQNNKNLYKNANNTDNLMQTQMDTNKLLYDFEKADYNFDESITNSEYITDNIVTLDKEIETFGTILEGCKKDRMVCEQDICSRIKTLNICKVTSQSTDKFHKICNFKKERLPKKKRRKTALNPRLYSRANKFNKVNGRTKMDENPVTKLTRDQTNRLEDILTRTDSSDDDNCFKHTNDQIINMAIIDGKLKTLQEKNDDADINKGGCGGLEIVADEWKNCFKMKDEKLRKINNRLKVLQNLKSTENNKETDNFTINPEE